MSTNTKFHEHLRPSSPSPSTLEETQSLLPERPLSTTSTQVDLPSTSPQTPTPTYKTLTNSDRTKILFSLTGLKSDPEAQASTTLPTPNLFTPSRYPQSLYTDVLHARQKAQFQFYISSTLYTLSLLAQLTLGATITAISGGIISSDRAETISVTVLAALNTVVAGVLALLHNSGLPDRMYNNWQEYVQVEVWMREVLMTGVLEEGVGVEEVIRGAWERFRKAGETVRGNRPASWIVAGVPGGSSKS